LNPHGIADIPEPSAGLDDADPSKWGDL